MSLLRAWGYVRVSSAEQFEHASSIAAQCRAIIFAAQSSGLDLGARRDMPVRAKDGSDVLIESRERIIFEAISAYATPFLQRPLASQLVQRLQAGDHLLFAKMDRAFCHVEDMGSMLRRFTQQGVLVYFLDNSPEPYNNSAMVEFQCTMSAASARFERKRKSERHREAFAARVEQGRRRIWIPCWQHAQINGVKRWAYLPEEREIQKQIFEWYIAGHSYRDIIRYLNHKGVVLQSLTAQHVLQWGTRFNRCRIKRILAAEFCLQRHAARLGKPDDHESVITAYRDEWLRCTDRDALLCLGNGTGQHVARRPRPLAD